MSGEHPGIESAADGFGEGMGDDEPATFNPTPAELIPADVEAKWLTAVFAGSGECCNPEVSAVFRTMGEGFVTGAEASFVSDPGLGFRLNFDRRFVILPFQILVGQVRVLRPKMVMGANSYSVPYHESRAMEIVELRNLLSYSSPAKPLRQSFSPIHAKASLA